ncbi:hypothetical protein C4J81_07570 [Deltaproteobacteria bacterium Smac51]|nr:hypothetical protein C4J81_07570 [Deltaproteobacteria bacterium Smac51]
MKIQIKQKPVIGITASNLPTADWDNSRFQLDRDGVLRLYSEAVAEFGGLPLILPMVRFPLELDEDDSLGPVTCGPGTLRENAGVYMDYLDGLILSGGGDVAPPPTASEPGKYQLVDKSRDIWESSLLAAALEKDKPVLGICRGVQLMNVALGGTLWADLPTERPGAVDHAQKTPRIRPSHPVKAIAGSRLAKIWGENEIMVNSGHHQGIRDVAAPLAVAAQSPDGLIEALEHTSARFVIGVQWHPEGQTSAPHVRSLFEAFINAAVG